MIVFLDTEFTGLGQRWPRLISIGLVAEDGEQSFYAELTAPGYLEKVTPWVESNVLPLLEGGERVMRPADLSERLAAWIGELGEIQIAGDGGVDTDFRFLESTLRRWPENLARQAIALKGNAFAAAVEKAYARGLRQHHALDDAKAIRQGRLVAGGGRQVKVYQAGIQLAADLPTGETLSAEDPERLAELLFAQGFRFDDVHITDWREGDRSPGAGQAIALKWKLRHLAA